VQILGLTKKLFGWLYPKPTLKEVILQLNTLGEMLDFHSTELESRADENRYKAVQYLKKELRDQARFSMKMHLQYLGWSRELQVNRASIEGLSIRLQQGDYLRQTVQALGNVRINLKNLSKILPNVSGLAQQADEISTAINQIQIAGRVTDSTMQSSIVPSSIKETSIDEALTTLEEELGLNSFPDPLGERVATAREEIRKLGETDLR
jgi:hypothetical protein